MCPAGSPATALSCSAPRASRRWLPRECEREPGACGIRTRVALARRHLSCGSAPSALRPCLRLMLTRCPPVLPGFPRLCAEHAVYQLYRHRRRARGSDVFGRVWCIWLGVSVAFCRAQLAAVSAPRSSRDGAEECPHASAAAQRFVHVLTLHAARARAAPHLRASRWIEALRLVWSGPPATFEGGRRATARTGHAEKLVSLLVATSVK